MAFPPVLTVLLAILVWLQIQAVEKAAQHEDEIPFVTSAGHLDKEESSVSPFGVPNPFAPENGLAIIYQRPLLAETRRRHVVKQETVEAVEKPKPVEAKPEIPPKPIRVLRGIVGLEGEKSALLYDPQDDSEIWVHAGDHIEGWEVSQITSEYVKFQYNELEFIVRLFP